MSDRSRSNPTRAATPPNPIASPTTRRRENRSCPVTVSSTAANNGTIATSSPAVELVSRVSAWPRSHHGPMISTAEYSSSPRQRRNTGARARRCSAIGRSSKAPRNVRPKATTTGSNTSTATRISRYGMPQSRESAAKSTQPRRLIPDLLHCSALQRRAIPPPDCPGSDEHPAVVLAPAHDSRAGRQSVDRPIRCGIHGQQPALPLIPRPPGAASTWPNVVDHRITPVRFLGPTACRAPDRDTTEEL